MAERWGSNPRRSAKGASGVHTDWNLQRVSSRMLPKCHGTRLRNLALWSVNYRKLREGSMKQRALLGAQSAEAKLVTTSR